MSAHNPNALVTLSVAAREIGITDGELRDLIASDDLDAHGHYDGIGWYVYRHSVEKLKRRTPFGGPQR